MKSKWLDRDMFRCSHYYCLCLTEAEFHAKLRYLKIPREDWPAFVLHWHSNATCHYFENQKTQSKTAIVCIKNYEDKTGIQIAALLTHEAVHLWQETCKDYGEREPSNELEAYAIQNIAQALMTSFEEQTK